MLCVGLEGQRVFEQRGKQESRSFDELLQIKWPKEVKATFSRAMFFLQSWFVIEKYAGVN